MRRCVLVKETCGRSDESLGWTWQCMDTNSWSARMWLAIHIDSIFRLLCDFLIAVLFVNTGYWTSGCIHMSWLAWIIVFSWLTTSNASQGVCPSRGRPTSHSGENLSFQYLLDIVTLVLLFLTAVSSMRLYPWLCSNRIGWKNSPIHSRYWSLNFNLVNYFLILTWSRCWSILRLRAISITSFDPFLEYDMGYSSEAACLRLLPTLRGSKQ